MAALQKGYKFIELDLLVTCDDKIIAAHDWDSFRKITGENTQTSKKCLSLKKAINRKIHDKYSVLDAEKINLIFKDASDVFLVTDKIKKFDILTHELDIAKERMLVEVFSFEDYRTALNYGIIYPMLCLWDKKDIQDNYLYLKNGNIKMITVPAHTLKENKKLIEKIVSYGVAVFTFTLNNVDEIKSFFPKTAVAFYTDTVLNADVTGEYTKKAKE